MTSRTILKILKFNGWYIINQRGSHIQLVNENNEKITFPNYKCDISENALKSIERQSKIKINS